jgi:hypothetical protein
VRNRLGRTAVTATLIGLTLGAVAMPARAQPIRIGPSYPPGPCVVLHIKVDNVLNEQVIITGCTSPLARLRVFVLSKPQLLGEFTANADGTFRRTFRLPTNLEAGTHHVRANVVGQEDTVSQAIQIAPASATKGSSRTPLGLLGLAIIGIGLALVVSTVRWRRRLVPAGAPRRNRSEARSTTRQTDVPFMDTSGFVPFASGGDEKDRPAGESGSGRDRPS